MIDTNVKGLLYVTRAVLPGMVARGRGHVINIGSVAGHETYPRGNVYCASKAAVRALNKAMRLDLLGTGIRVSTSIRAWCRRSSARCASTAIASGPARVYQDTRPLSAADVAEAIVWCTSRPGWVNVEEFSLDARLTSPRPPWSTAGRCRRTRPTQPPHRWPSAGSTPGTSMTLDGVLGPIYRTHATPARAFGRSAVTARPWKGATPSALTSAAGLEKYPELRFEPISVSCGPQTVAVEYRAHGVDGGGSTIELLAGERQRTDRPLARLPRELAPRRCYAATPAADSTR